MSGLKPSKTLPARIKRKIRSLQTRLGFGRNRPIRLHRSRIKGDTITVDIDPGSAHRFIRQGEFWAQYEGIDLRSVPESVRIVPAVGAIFTTACALGIPIELDEVDKDFADSIARVSAVLSGWYPKFSQRGTQIHGRVIQAARTPRDGNLLLYSGGVDAVASLIRNIEHTRALLTVWGADVPVAETELWKKLNEETDPANISEAIHRYQVKSNLRDFVRGKHLVERFIGGPHSWWMKVQHGPALIALASPVAHALSLSNVMIASTHSKDFSLPWGSSPELDTNIVAAGIATKHDSFDLSRQQKLQNVIVPFLSQKRKKLRLAVCYSRSRVGGAVLNCGACEKCIRTIFGLLAAGYDPKEAGLPVDLSLLDDWKRGLESREIMLSGHIFNIWTDIQAHAVRTDPLGFEQYKQHLQWLRQYDFARNFTGSDVEIVQRTQA